MAADPQNVVPLHANTTPPSPQALVEIGRRALDRLEALLPVMGDAYRREIVEYAAMDAEHFAHVLTTSRNFVGRFMQALVDGVTDPVPEHAVLQTAGRRRQEAGISLDAAMHAFRIASRVGWTAIADTAAEVDPLLVGDLAGRWIEFADRAATAFAEGHTTASTEQLRRVDARRQALVSDLLAADDEASARAVAARHGLRLADRHTPVLVDGPCTVDRLAGLLSPGTVVGHRGDHLVALVPGEVAADRLTLLAGEGLVVHGRPATPGAALLAEVAATESVLAAARAGGRSAGLLGPGDLVLERVVREHADLERHLRARVLEPLAAADPDGIFRDTLVAWLETGAIRAVADQLFVHANTVSYRLRRIAEVTGLDPRVPEQAAHLVLAVALDRATATESDRSAAGLDQQQGDRA